MLANQSADKLNFLAIVLYISTIGIFLVLGLSKYLIILFPLLSAFLGIFLYYRSYILYLEFTLWMWFIGSFIRRIIDYQSGYLTPGPWNLSAYLVTIISLESFFKNIVKQKQHQELPFTLCFGSIAYASLIGLINNPIDKTVIIYNLNWLAPLSLCYWIYRNWRYYPEYIASVRKTFSRGLLLIGVYGILQFVVAPPWDRFYLEQKQLLLSASSFGRPEPYGMRIWSTMGSPHSMGIVLMAGLILLVYFRHNRIANSLSLVAGYIALLLTKARTIWLAWVIGISVLVLIQTKKYGYQLTVSLAVIGALLLILITFGPLNEIVYPRLESIVDLSNDVSFQARLEGYNLIENAAFSEVIGKGLGYSISAYQTSLGRNDSTILPFLLTFGWFGVIPYMSGIVLMLFDVFRNLSRLDIFASMSLSISVAILMQIGLLYIFKSSTSIFFWFFMGLSLAAVRYMSYEKSVLKSSHTLPVLIGK